MKRLIIIEWGIIFAAMLSIWPWLLGYRSGWYRALQIAVLLALIWVTRNRLRRARGAMPKGPGRSR
jgi:hypothetical protein